MTRVIVAGTRRSRLALAQTQLVVAQLRSVQPDLEIRVEPIVTAGDRASGPLRAAGKGAFTGALEDALQTGQIDFAVHSLKDLPVELPAQLILGAIVNRVTALDVLVAPGGTPLHELPNGSRIGTSSQRRKAQLKAYRPDFQIIPIRGNVDTRIKKMQRGLVDALVLAEAGLIRLGRQDEPHMPIDLDVMVPAPGQGALAVECRKDDADAMAFLKQLDCRKTRMETVAERTFLQALGGGCTLPVGALAQWEGKSLSMRAVVSSRDGSQAVRVRGHGSVAQSLGQALARKARERGAMAILNHG